MRIVAKANGRRKDPWPFEPGQKRRGATADPALPQLFDLTLNLPRNLMHFKTRGLRDLLIATTSKPDVTENHRRKVVKTLIKAVARHGLLIQKLGEQCDSLNGALIGVDPASANASQRKKIERLRKLRDLQTRLDQEFDLFVYIWACVFADKKGTSKEKAERMEAALNKVFQQKVGYKGDPTLFADTEVGKLAARYASGAGACHIHKPAKFKGWCKQRNTPMADSPTEFMVHLYTKGAAGMDFASLGDLGLDPKGQKLVRGCVKKAFDEVDDGMKQFTAAVPKTLTAEKQIEEAVKLASTVPALEGLKDRRTWKQYFSDFFS